MKPGHMKWLDGKEYHWAVCAFAGLCLAGGSLIVLMGIMAFIVRAWLFLMGMVAP